MLHHMTIDHNHNLEKDMKLRIILAEIKESQILVTLSKLLPVMKMLLLSCPS
jgi:hypothetical protein